MFFAVSSWYASILRESNAIVRDNPHYRFDRKKIMIAYIFTFNILAIPLYLVYIGAVSSVLFSVAGITRLFTTLLMFTLGACFTSTVVFDPFRKDSEQSTSVAFFGGGCIGLFIAYFGSVFPLLVFIAFMLKEWKSLNTTGFEIASEAAE
jgi:ribose/xylose/arabinose/galactoside ABC-type transport system permease subunit